MKKRLFIFFVTILTFNYYSMAQNNSKKTELSAEDSIKYSIKVSFMYYTSDAALSKKEQEFVSYLKTKQAHIKYHYVPFKNEFGDWGPCDYYFSLETLKEKEKMKFIEEIKEYFKNTPSIKITNSSNQNILPQ